MTEIQWTNEKAIIALSEVDKLKVKLSLLSKQVDTATTSGFIPLLDLFYKNIDV